MQLGCEYALACLDQLDVQQKSGELYRRTGGLCTPVEVLRFYRVQLNLCRCLPGKSDGSLENGRF